MSSGSRCVKSSLVNRRDIDDTTGQALDRFFEQIPYHATIAKIVIALGEQSLQILCQFGLGRWSQHIMMLDTQLIENL